MKTIYTDRRVIQPHKLERHNARRNKSARRALGY
jgi:hypothetical protein